MDWGRLFRHNHWLIVRIGKNEVGLCARCSGTVLGYFSTFLLHPFAFLAGFGSLSPLHQVIFAFLLALPSGIDWVTQTWSIRMSTNRIRFSVGLLVGCAACILGLSSLPNFTKLLILSYSSMTFVAVGYLGKRLVTHAIYGRRRTVQLLDEIESSASALPASEIWRTCSQSLRLQPSTDRREDDHEIGRMPVWNDLLPNFRSWRVSQLQF